VYPLHVTLPAPAVGFAVANDATEHQALTAAGYVPAYVAPAPTLDRAALLEQAAAKGLKVDGRWSDERIAKELAA
jgi:hypothetical protein